MSNIGALLFAVVVGGLVWFFGAQVEPRLTETWFLGTGLWDGFTLEGRVFVSAVIGLASWIAGLHIARA